MPIPFRDLGEDGPSGVAAYIRFIDELDGKGVRGALFVMSTRGEPLEFSFTRVDLRSGVLWRAGQARSNAVSSLTRSLFEAASHVPDVVLALAEETPPSLFSEGLRVHVPLCRVAGGSPGPVATSEEVQCLPDSITLVWVNGLPQADGNSAWTVDRLARNQLLLEPFDRAALALQEAFDS